jgi:hypothetical protein
MSLAAFLAELAEKLAAGVACITSRLPVRANRRCMRLWKS